MKDVPVPRSRTPIGPHGYGQGGTRIDPWARRPVAMRPDGHRRAGTRNHPFASRGHPWALMGTRKRREGCVALGKALGHRVGSIPGSDGKVHRFEGCARPCALIDARIRRRAPAIPEEGRRLWCASIPSSAGGPHSIAPMRDSLMHAPTSEKDVPLSLMHASMSEKGVPLLKKDASPFRGGSRMSEK